MSLMEVGQNVSMAEINAMINNPACFDVVVSETLETLSPADREVAVATIALIYGLNPGITNADATKRALDVIAVEKESSISR